ncbi:MAG: hypothetical protein MUQ32_10360 [Chloroflexi bacterium]|nr:hypothetical protein [Chloroflexota bacterium]
MTARSTLRAVVIGIAAVLLLAPPVLADTCCANVPVKLDPPSAVSGDTVRLTGLRCLRSDGTGPLSLNLGAFWLATGHRPAEDPGDVPGNLPYPDLPPIEKWLPFESAPPFDSTTRGDATIIVPDLPDGRYQLWWLCDNGGGEGSGIHYSPGPRLAIGVPPDTATEAVGSPGATGSHGWPVWFVLALGAFVFVVTLWSPHTRNSRPARRRSGSR